ncbi:MAG: hypothetical protein D6782_12165 [Alphaproteobacteria bacterium]|nr:MAG: hypothetical protein D6782_12165 [Alphaproteobacteria bacterium]
MEDKLASIRARMAALEREIEEVIEARRQEFHYEVVKRRAHFEASVRRHHAKLKIGLARFLRRASWGSIATAPFIYAMIVPLALLDAMLWLYQQTCFRAYRIPRVQRRDFVAIDRHRLGYLNAIERLNCAYCGYANGVLAYAVEIASRTEQYWCPIKHAIRIAGAHRRYAGFIDYGDAEDYHERLKQLREKLRQDEEG